MNATNAWLEHIAAVVFLGAEINPRGKATKEIPQQTMIVDMRRPVVLEPSRKLSYTFMAAESHWMLTGDDRVETIAKFNPRIAQYSDDGVKFFGAYGPKIVSQMAHVIDTLRKDPASRQAGLTIWRENPTTTKDVPCTVAMWFFIRHGRVNCHVFMRSSDAWLGVPYDVFNFSMVAHMVCCGLNLHGCGVKPGKLYLTMASAHIYEEHWELAKALPAKVDDAIDWSLTPPQLYTSFTDLINTLDKLRYSKPGDSIRWWNKPSGDLQI